MTDIAAQVEEMLDKNANAACAAARELAQESERSPGVYPYFMRIAGMLENKNSYVRSRALTVLAANARWDTEDCFAAVIESYLAHITDEKPITARQCVQALPEIARQKPALRARIRDALMQADMTGYAQSMRPLLERDVAQALEKIDRAAQS